MEIRDMISLYMEEGITAADVLTLNKAGYTPELIKELKNNGMQSDDIKKQADEKQAEQEQQKQIAEESKKESEALSEELEAAKKEIADLKNLIGNIQADNRGKDIEGELPKPDDYKKNITDYISSLM